MIVLFDYEMTCLFDYMQEIIGIRRLKRQFKIELKDKQKEFDAADN